MCSYPLLAQHVQHLFLQTEQNFLIASLTGFSTIIVATGVQNATKMSTDCSNCLPMMPASESKVFFGARGENVDTEFKITFRVAPDVRMIEFLAMAFFNLNASFQHIALTNDSESNNDNRTSKHYD